MPSTVHCPDAGNGHPTFILRVSTVDRIVGYTGAGLRSGISGIVGYRVNQSVRLVFHLHMF
jgi:hypothetical protein